MKTLGLTIALLCISSLSFSQQTGLVDYPQLGIQFMIPDGWVGQESEAGYLMGSNSIPGIILVMTNEIHSLDQMKEEALKGIADNNGTNLSPSGPVTNISSDAVGGPFSGTLEWQPAKAYMIGKINNKGYGVTIIAATSSEAYDTRHEQVAKEVLQSVIFSQPVIPSDDTDWGELLKDARLTYVDSDYSNDGSYGDSGYTTGGGYNNKVVIDLCAQGYFTHSQVSSMSYDAGGASVGSGNQNSGSGKWQVIKNPVGQSILQLTLNNGNIHDLVISLEDNKTYLNGERCYRTYGRYRDDGPDCQ